MTGPRAGRRSPAITGTLPPVVTAERIVVAGEGLAVLDAATGRVVWSAMDARAATAPVAHRDLRRARRGRRPSSLPRSRQRTAAVVPRHRERATGGAGRRRPRPHPRRHHRPPVPLPRRSERRARAGRGGWAPTSSTRRRCSSGSCSSPPTRTCCTPSTAATATWPGGPPSPRVPCRGPCSSATRSSWRATARVPARPSSSDSTRAPASGRAISRSPGEARTPAAAGRGPGVHRHAGPRPRVVSLHLGAAEGPAP